MYVLYDIFSIISFFGPLTFFIQYPSVTTQTNILRKNVIEKNGEVEQLKHEMNVLDRLRAQLVGKSEQLLNERQDIAKEAEALAMQVSVF